MTLFKLCSITAAALALSGCVVLDTAPPEAVGPGPFLTGNFNAPAAAPAQATSLRDQLAGRSLSSVTTTHYLWSDGTHTIERSGFQGFGTWSVNGNTLCLRFEHPTGSGTTCGTVVINGNIATFSPVSGDTPVNYTLG